MTLVQRTIGPEPTDAGSPVGIKRRVRRARAISKFVGRRVTELRSALRSAAILALVGVVLFSPLLLDDVVFRASYLMRPSEDTITITAPAKITEQPPIELTRGVLSLPPALSGKPRSGEAVAALIRDGSARLVLKNANFVVDLAGSTREIEADHISYFRALAEPFLSAMSPLVDALQSSAFETLAIRDGTVDIVVGTDRLERLTALDADVSVQRKSATRLKGTATFRGEPVRFDVTLGPRTDRAGVGTALLKVRIEAANLQATIDGRLKIDGGVALSQATADVQVANVRALARQLGHVWPAGNGFKDFSARGQLDWSGRNLSMSRGRFTMDGNEATGTLALTLDTARPLIAGTLAFGRLDVSAHVPVVEAADAGRPILAALRSTRDVRWPMLGMLDADLRLSAEEFRGGAFSAGRTAASVSVRDSQVLVNIAEMLLADGARAMGELGLAGPASHPALVARGRIDEIDMAVATTRLTGLPLLRGRGHLSVDLSSTGVTGLDVLNRISGKLEVGLPDGGTVPCSHVSILAAARAAMANKATAISPDAAPAAPQTSPPPTAIPSAVTVPVPSDLCRASLQIGPSTFQARVASGVVGAGRLEVVAGEDLVRLSGNHDLMSSEFELALTVGPQPKAPPPPITTPVGAIVPRLPPVPTDRDVLVLRGRTDAVVVEFPEP
jgi:hypothetical protein